MTNFHLWAQPWWVNLLILIPLLVFAWRKRPAVHRHQLAMSALFALAFGFVEAAVVVYLRAAVGLLPGYHGTLADIRQAAPDFYRQAEALRSFPPSLLAIEVSREAATMVMLFSVAILSAGQWSSRGMVFLWTFAIWDASYYAGLWATVRWPGSLSDFDILFLIPVPWVAQVWFPLLVSGLTVVGIAVSSARAKT